MVKNSQGDVSGYVTAWVDENSNVKVSSDAPDITVTVTVKYRTKDSYIKEATVQVFRGTAVLATKDNNAASIISVSNPICK